MGGSSRRDIVLFFAGFAAFPLCWMFWHAVKDPMSIAIATGLAPQVSWRLRDRDPRRDGAVLQPARGLPVNSLPGKTGPGLPDAFRALLSSAPYGPLDENADTDYGSRTAVERLEQEMRLKSSNDGYMYENPLPLSSIGFMPFRPIDLPPASELDIVIPCIRDLTFLESWKAFVQPYHVIIIQDGDPGKLLSIPAWVDFELYNRNDIDAALGPDRAWIMSAHDSAVRAFGFLVSKARYIYTLDDDCFPPADGSNPVELHLRNLATPSTPYFFNTLYDPYASDNDFVRGYPYSLRSGVPTVISHGLWLNAPDYDAPTQLMKPAERNRRQVDAVITVPAGVFMPMCGMNIAFDRAKIGPAFMLGLMGDGQPWGRYDDMIMGWTGKACADAMGLGVKSGAPYIVHNKASNPFVNLKKEYKGLEWQEHAIDFFKRLELSKAASSSAQACYLETADALEASLAHLHPYFSRFARAMRLWIGAWDEAQAGALMFNASRASHHRPSR